MLLNKQATDKDYKYTLGGGLVGAIAGAAMTKLLEDEDKKASLKDYLVGTAVGSGLGLLGGRFLDIADDSRKNKLVALTKERARLGNEMTNKAYGKPVAEANQVAAEQENSNNQAVNKNKLTPNQDVMPKSLFEKFNENEHPNRWYTYGIGGILGPGLGLTRYILRKALKQPKALNNWGFRLFNGLGYTALGAGVLTDLVNVGRAYSEQAPIVKDLENYDKLTQEIRNLKDKQ